MTLQEGLQAGLRVRVLDEPKLERVRGNAQRLTGKKPFDFHRLTWLTAQLGLWYLSTHCRSQN